MSPKKKSVGGISDGPVVGVYELDLMTDEELRTYIEALKEESERMRKSFGNHQQEKKELTVLLMNTQEQILTKKDDLLQKEMEYQRLLSESSGKVKSEAEKTMISQVETNEATERAKLATFAEMKTAISLHKAAERKLKDCLMRHQREVEKYRLERKFFTLDLKEKELEQHAELMEAKEDTLNGISDEYIQKYRDEMQKFYTSKVNTLNFIWNDITEKNICDKSVAEYAEKMTLYFRDLMWKNSKASSILKDKIQSLEKDAQKLRIQLKKVENENEELLEKMEYQTNLPKYSSTLKPIDTRDAELEEVIYENDVLHEKLRQVTSERDTLRNRFISAMRTICQKADFAYFLAEELLCFAQEKSTKSKQK